MKITIKAEGVTIVAEGEGDDGLMLRNVFCEMLEKAANPAYSVMGQPFIVNPDLLKDISDEKEA